MDRIWIGRFLFALSVVSIMGLMEYDNAVTIDSSIVEPNEYIQHLYLERSGLLHFEESTASLRTRDDENTS